MANARTLYWKEIWRSRELIYIFSWRDIKVRYKQTFIGIAWSVLKPLLTTVIFTIVFSRITKFPNPSEAPYILMVFSGMLVWQFFSTTLGDISNSIVGSAGLIGKIYFPRMVIPLASVITNLVDFVISLVIMTIMMLFYHYSPDWQVVFLPFFVLMLIACAVGAGLIFSAMNVKYRDFKFIVPFILQLGIFITPVAFSSSNIEDKWRLLYAVNPVVGIISGFRWCLLHDPIYWPEVLISCCFIVILLLIAFRYFRNMEKTFSDNI